MLNTGKFCCSSEKDLILHQSAQLLRVLSFNPNPANYALDESVRFKIYSRNYFASSGIEFALTIMAKSKTVLPE